MFVRDREMWSFPDTYREAPSLRALLAVAECAPERRYVNIAGFARVREHIFRLKRRPCYSEQQRQMTRNDGQLDQPIPIADQEEVGVLDHALRQLFHPTIHIVCSSGAQRLRVTRSPDDFRSEIIRAA